MRDTVNDFSGLVHLEQSKVRTTRDVEQNATRTFDRCFEQRTGDRLAGSRGRPTVTRAVTDTHQRRARIAEDHLDVGEVGVDQAGDRDEVGDALHALEQNLVGHLECVDHGGLVAGNCEETIVWDDDHRVDLLFELGDTNLGLHPSAPTFERERTRHDADGQRTL